MAKFLLGVLVGVVIVVLVAVISVLAIGKLFGNKQPVISPNAVLVLGISGDVPESSPVDLAIPFLQSPGAPTVTDVWNSLHRAASDNRVKALLIQPRDLTIGWAKLQEIHRDIEDFKKSGKPVYALLQGPGSKEYYLGSAADRIFLSPDDVLEVKGFRIEETYLKNTLDKLGIGVDVDHIGRFKDAGDLYTRTGMSPETREVLNQVLDQLFGDFCSTVATARHKSADSIRALVDMGPFTAAQAKAVGLIDELGYEDNVFSEIKGKTGSRDLNRVPFRTYFRAVPGRGDRIAMLVGEGEITRGEPEGGFNPGGSLSSGGFSKVVRQVREDKGIKGVIVRVDSPGGDAVASDEILHELKLLSKAKPVVISMSDLAASGGYFISMTGDPVVSYPNTITGSIGVLYVRPNLKGLFDKLGLQQETITRGKLADLDSLTTPLSDAARQKLHESIEWTYKEFVSKVASARRRTYDQIDPLAQGRVWMGAQARQNGLVDQLGGISESIALIRKRAHLSERGETELVAFPPRQSLLDLLFNSSSSSVADHVLNFKIRSLLPGLPGHSLLKGGMLRVMPYSLSVQ
ncbi:MAG: signal peptide peptidase SppA [Bryobacteraceae bacterium]